MILILASIADPEASSFAGEFGGSACVLTCNDVVRGPTRILHPAFHNSTLTAAGRAIAVRDISAVVNLLPAVVPNELTLYPAAERTYQAAEMRALLTYFLSSVKCPVINRATPLHLNGPVQNPVAWLAAANRVGIPVSLPQSDSPAPPIEVISVGGRLIQSSGTIADDYTQQLAAHYHLEYLKAFYHSPQCETESCKMGSDALLADSAEPVFGAATVCKMGPDAFFAGLTASASDLPRGEKGVWPLFAGGPRPAGRPCPAVAPLHFIGADADPDIRNPHARAALRARLLEAAA